jgi:hypothetical protein
MPSTSKPADLRSQIESFLYRVTELQGALSTPQKESTPPIFATPKDSEAPKAIAYKEIDPKAINQQIIQLQQQFQAILATVAAVEADCVSSTNSADASNVDPDQVQRLRPFQIEAHRRLRLLAIEAMRLAAAQQTATLERGLQQVQAHLGALQTFARAMADELSD